MPVRALLSWWRAQPVRRADGMPASADPVQVDFASPQPPIELGGATLHPLADFQVAARVLAREKYHFDAKASLSPTDLVLGWGRMSDSAVLRHIDVAQGGRFYRWHVKAFPIPRREIEAHSPNMHIIPADDRDASALARVRVGEVVAFSGLLVEADKPGGWRWRSSMTRADTGPGACELVYVRALEITPR